MTDEQHDAVRNQRRLELQQRQDLFQWGDDPTFINLPGYYKGERKTLPKDVQFAQEGAEDLHNSRNKALANLGLLKLLNLFDPWDDFEDYRKVDFHYRLMSRNANILEFLHLMLDRVFRFNFNMK